MKKLTPYVRVDVDAEIAAMVAYLATRYDNLLDPVAMFKRIADEAHADTPLWFVQGDVSPKILARATRRKELLKDAGFGERCTFSDAPLELLVNLTTKLSNLHAHAQNFKGEWWYDKQARAAFHRVVSDVPSAVDVLPKGWAKALATYREHADMSAYAENGQLPDEDAFEGVDSSGGCSGGFTFRTALTSIMYDHQEQNRRAPYAFFSAVYSHFLVVLAHNRTVDIAEAFESLDLSDTVAELVFDLPAKLVTGNPVMDAALELAVTDGTSAADLRDRQASFVANEARRATLSPEALAAEEVAGKARVREMFSSLFSKAPDPAAAERLEKAELNEIACLKAHYLAANPL
jgi:hypothetical protein